MNLQAETAMKTAVKAMAKATMTATLNPKLRVVWDGLMPILHCLPTGLAVGLALYRSLRFRPAWRIRPKYLVPPIP